MRVVPCHASVCKIPTEGKQVLSKGVILMYHRIGEPMWDAWGVAVSPACFEQHLACIRRNYEAVSLDRLFADLPRGAMPRRWIAVTFDDGYADNLYQAKPLLERYQIPATVFAVTSQIGAPTEFWWDELERIFMAPQWLPNSLSLVLSNGLASWELSSGVADDGYIAVRHRGWRAWERDAATPRHEVYRQVHGLMVGLHPHERADILEQLRRWAGDSPPVRPEYRAMTVEELIELADGLISVGSHTVTHTPLHLMSGDALRNEVVMSKRFLEHVLTRPVPSFSYPFGSRVAETVAAVERAGYAYACSSLSHQDVESLAAGSSEAIVQAPASTYELPRLMVENWDAAEFDSRLARWFGN